MSPSAPFPMLAAVQGAGVDWLLTVPASGLEPLYDDYAGRGRCIFATREEEAVAIAAGLALGGARPLVVMQQSGVGNALNAVFTLADAYGIAFPIAVMDRGDADPNPVQRVSSSSTLPLLRQMGAAVVADWSAPDAPGALVRAFSSPAARWLISPIRKES